MLARPVANTIHAVITVRLFAASVRAVLAHPRNHATAAEPVTALARCEPTPLRIEQHGAAGTISEGGVSCVLGCCVGGVESIAILAACLV